MKHLAETLLRYKYIHFVIFIFLKAKRGSAAISGILLYEVGGVFGCDRKHGNKAKVPRTAALREHADIRLLDGRPTIL